MWLQGKDALVSEQTKQIKMLLQELQNCVSINGPINSLSLLLIVGDESVAHYKTGVEGAYLVRRGAVTEFLEEASFRAGDVLRDLTHQERAEIEGNVAGLFLQSFIKFSNLCTERP